MSKRAMQTALDALTGVLDDDKDVRKASITGGLYEVVGCRQAIAELRAAIAAPEVEPVGCVAKDGFTILYFQVNALPFETDLYTTPPDTEALRRDAERYRWLQTRAYVGVAPYPKPHEVWCLRLPNPKGFNNLDAAIDAAINAKETK